MFPPTACLSCTGYTNGQGRTGGFSLSRQPILLYFAVMKKILFIGYLLAAASCGSNEKPAETAENNVDAARNFVRAALDGKFREARDYMIQDSLNLNYLDVAERSFKHLSQEVQDGYRASSIRFHQPIINPDDSTSYIIFSNSYKNDPDTLRLLRIKGQWLVDLKYLYLHDQDSADKARFMPIPADTAK